MIYGQTEEDFHKFSSEYQKDSYQRGWNDCLEMFNKLLKEIVDKHDSEKDS